MKKTLVLALMLLAGCATTQHTQTYSVNFVNPNYPFLSGGNPMTGPAATPTPAAPMQSRYGPIYTP